MKEKGRFLKKYRGIQCLNCNTPLDVIDKYCFNCGQINSTKKLSLKDFFSEFFSSIFSYDSRLSKTVMALLFKPGKISREYIEGKRIKYANPFRFYLSVSIIFFLINGFFIDLDSAFGSIDKGINEIKVNDKEIEQALQNIDSLKINNNIRILIKEQLDSAKNKPVKEIEKSEKFFTEAELDTMNPFKRATKLWDMYDEHYDNTKQRSAYNALEALDQENTWYRQYLYERVVKINAMEDNHGKELTKFLLDKLPFTIFFFLPFFALSIWLLYIRRPFTYMEHLIFTFHTQTMFFFILGISLLLDQILKTESIVNIAMILFLIYLYKAMRRFYQQGRLKTIVKFLFVNVLFFILATIGTIFVVLGSIIIY